jgi:outer membrane autotransporter protein
MSTPMRRRCNRRRALTGGVTGIYADNEGTGGTTVNATGTVTGIGDTGISVTNGSTTTGGLTVNAAAVSGGINGIYTTNLGGGGTTVNAAGVVTGTSPAGAGISALNGSTATGLTVNAGTVSGGDGIVASNQGTGGTTINATGAVTGMSRVGIAAVNYSTANGMTVNAAAVSGVRAGIVAENEGSGTTRVTATGNVAAGVQGYGIQAVNGTVHFNADGAITGVDPSKGTSLTVNATNVTSGFIGIYANNQGTGTTSVTSTGAVTGSSNTGIYATNGATATSLTVNAAAVSGGFDGIYANNQGAGTTSITTTGIVQGRTAGIDALSAGQAIGITITGAGAEVRNTSQSPADVAIAAAGGAVTLTNQARLTGTVLLGDLGNLMINSGIWTTAGGTNSFGASTNSLVNQQGGTIVAAVAGAATPVTTSFDGLTSFTNRGLLTLQNGVAGDIAHFSGNMTSVAGSVQAIDLNKAGQSDRVIVDGKATITGTTLNIANQGGYTVGTRYTVLTATGGLTGTYASLTGAVTSAFLGVVDSYDANDAYLNVVQIGGLASAGQTRNQIATAGGLSTLPSANALYQAILKIPTPGQARAAFDSLSGEVHASAQTALIDDSHFIRDAAVDRIRQSFEAVGAPSMPMMAYAADAAPTSDAIDAMAYAMPTKAVPLAIRTPASTLAIWGQTFGSWSRTGGDGNAAKLDHSTGGVITGFDSIVAETWRLGLLAGYSRSNFSVTDRASSGQSDNYHVGLYGGTQWGAIGFRTGAAYTWHDITTARSVALPGCGDNLRADYTAGTTQVFGELGYRLDVNRVALEPFANLAYVNLRTDGFTEQGGLAALTGSGSSADVTFTTLGARASTGFMLGSVNATARGTLGWSHAFGDVTPFSTPAFAGSNAFSIAGVPVARDTAVVEAGLDFALTRAATVGIFYGGQFGNNASEQSVRGNLLVKF